jgi:hypothetical protein
MLGTAVLVCVAAAGLLVVSVHRGRTPASTVLAFARVSFAQSTPVIFANQQRIHVNDAWHRTQATHGLTDPLNARFLTPAEVIPLPPGRTLRFFLYDTPEIESVFADCSSCLQRQGLTDMQWNWKHSVELWTWTQLREHPWRTRNAREATVFFIPSCAAVARAMLLVGHECPWEAWQDRIIASVERYGMLNQSMQHVLISTQHSLARNLGQQTFARLADGSARLGTVDWTFTVRTCGRICGNNAMIVPYQINSALLESALVSSGILPIRERTHDVVFVGTLQLLLKSPLRLQMSACLQSIKWTELGLRAEVHESWSSAEGYRVLYPQAMLNGRVCLIPPGDSPASQRLFEAIGVMV